jgi:tetratricopeptide (TPR) repeat protein
LAEAHLAQIAMLRLRGHSYHEAGKFDQAIACYGEVIQLDPKNAIAFNNRGSEYSSKGDLDKAIADCTEAIRLDPKYASAYNERGWVYDKKGEHDKSTADLTESVRLDPNMAASSYRNRGRVDFNKGEYDKAIANLTEGIRLNPKEAMWYHDRGSAYLNKRDYDKAIADFTEAIRLDPNYALTHNDLAWLHATCPDEKYRDGKKAVENTDKACQLTEGRDWSFTDTLAGAYAENGDFEKAKELESKAIELAVTNKSATEKVKAEMASRLELYKQRKPYREAPKK